MRTEVPTIQCPGCGRTLPAQILKCHFCGDDLAFAARPEEKKQPLIPDSGSRFERLYRGVAFWWILDGVLAILVAMEILPPWASALSNMLVSYLGVALTTGFLITILGVGMLLKVPLARQLVSAFCWFRMIAGLFGLGIILRTGDYQVQGHNLIWLALLNAMDTVFAAFQIWLLSVTDYEILN